MNSNGSGDGWQTPKDIMRRMKLKKKGVFKNRSSRHSFTPSKQFSQFLAQSESLDSPAPKRQKINPTEDEFLLNEDFKPVLNEKDFMDAEETDEQTVAKDSIVVEQCSETLPCDWTIKNKIRIISPNTFSWYNRVKGSEEAMATAKSVRCDHNNASTDKIELGKCLYYFQFPEIPWLKLFPRYGSEYEAANPNHFPIPQNDVCKNMLHDNWVASLRSVFHLLKEDLCPYFYVCAQQYTALFRARSVSQNNELTCVVTPTTLGLRQTLTRENIKFTMPFQIQTLDDADELEESCDVAMEMEDDEMWSDVRSGVRLQANKAIKQAVRTDSSMHTAVLVQGTVMINLLFNFIANSKSSIAISGPQTGIPPTLLSPVAFLGSNVKKVFVKSGTAKIMGTNGQRPLTCSSLDISGPIMPGTFHEIIKLVSKTQKDEFTLNCTNTKYTIPFNAVLKANQNNENVESNADRNETVTKLGLSQNTYEYLTKPPHTLREITYKDKSFTWKH